MSQVNNLFTDEHMRQFISNGFIVLNVDMPEGFHEHIYQRCEAVYDTEGNPGNNLLPRVPELQQVFDHPTITGAFSSLLGPDFVMHTHRHGHLTKGKTEDRGWHKDSYWGYKKIRYHRPRWAMVFYYPQTITLQNGPTRVVAGSHCYDQRFEQIEALGQPVLGQAGTIAIVHFDIWHQASANFTDANRFMMKFQFHRMSEPQKPTWNNVDTQWQSLNNDLSKHDVMWQQHWNWLCGQSPVAQTGDIQTLTQALTSQAEPERLNAAYTLGAMGESATETLIQALTGDNDHARRVSAYGLSLMGESAVDALQKALTHPNDEVRAHAAFALGDMGAQAEDATSALTQTLKDASPWVRHHAVEALGTIASHADTSVPALAHTLTQDEDAQVRYNAAYALACFGTDAAEAVPALKQALNDSNRYVSGHAVTALRRIRTPQAVDTLLHWMETTRWCPVTTKESTF